MRCAQKTPSASWVRVPKPSRFVWFLARWRRAPLLPTSQQDNSTEHCPISSDCEHENRKIIVNSGASLRMMSKNELTSGDKDTIRRSKQPTVLDGRNTSLHQRFGRLCHNDAVGRFTSGAIAAYILRRKWTTPTNGTGRVSIVGLTWKSDDVQV